MPLPVAHSLVGASIVTLALRQPSWQSAWGPVLVGAFLGALPDVDLLLSWGLGLGHHYHGSYTHSILFAVAAGAGVALLRGEEELRAVLGYVGATLSHGLLDTLTKDQFGGAALLWPWSFDRYRLGLIPNYDFYPNPAVQSWRAILLAALPHLAYELKNYLPVIILALAIRIGLTRQTHLIHPKIKPDHHSNQRNRQMSRKERTK
ncbi:MAG: metal-dependent hydrolase [Acidobacteria bacterium]|nr:metal-dependent hydrolase [Acidobacteriota bacterium]